ncbi:geranylgeranyl transferase type-1 subunit beta isoform X2 [Pieris brassicae]|uniref:geranylgeranyl transferase type-1 subunit beta isoform X2 n=1 Tax=Pieris brassicae TaxID=7116 RepID=UPI001E661A74|nr:geranylgeranyl transferase type-1 subunit beta isoform X2 [Pieris brassicae]
MNNEESIILANRQHGKYFMRFLNVLPASLSSHDTTRVTIAYFAVSGLDVLGSISTMSLELQNRIIQWIYRLQVHPDKDSVKALQTEEGNFAATLSGCESDMRFVYCAACISYILNDWSGFNIKSATDYIIKSIGYDYGIAQCPELESHGGTTFCALATLSLTNQLDQLSEAQIEGLKRWLLLRQIDGFQGRPNKPVDTCYSFWVGASLKILNALHLSDYANNRSYVYETQDIVVGGFSKWPDTCTDPMHTYLGLAGLSLIGESGLFEIVPTLNISKRAHEHLKTLHEQWASS